MADDVTLNGASGTFVAATDDIGSGRQAQLVKPIFGGDGVATMVTGSTPLPVADTATVLTGSASAVGTVIGPFDASSFANIIVSTSGTYSATVQLQGSLDQATWVSVSRSAAISGSSLGGSPVNQSTNIATGTHARAAVLYPYYRLQTTTYTSGTVNGSIWLSRYPALVSVTGAEDAFGRLAVTAASSGSTSTYVDGSSPWGAVGLQGYTGSTYDRWRNPNVVKTVAATAAGNTSLWTPGSGNRWRLMRAMVMLSSDAAIGSGGVLTIDLKDGATNSTGVTFSPYVPATGGTGIGGWTSGWFDLGNGIQSAANAQDLNVNLSAALTTGVCRVIACGTQGTGTAA